MQITPFLFEAEALVRVVHIDGEPWWVAADVCRVLEIANSRDAVGKLDDDERADVGLTDTSSNGTTQKRNVTVINESGLYTLILRSRDATKPGTVPHRFRKWVTSEVIPSIRKTGEYKTAAKAEDDKEKESLAMLRKVRTVTETRRAFGVPAAQQVWFELGLPVVPAMLEGDRQSDLFTRRTKGEA